MEFVVKRVYEQPDPDDGYRALVDRLWPRGMRKDKAAIDEWAKDLAPSAELRSWYHQDLDARREEFAARYREELSASEAVEDFLRRTGGQERVTLLYAARDTQHNHALVLRDVLQERPPRDEGILRRLERLGKAHRGCPRHPRKRK